MEETFFKLSDLQKLICAADTIPPESNEIVICDYALSDNPRSDGTALCAAHVAMVSEQKHFWFTDCVWDRWSQQETAYQVVKFLSRHNPARTFIERLSGHELLKAEIFRQAERYGMDIHGDISFFKPSKKADAKKLRILTLKQAAEEGRVHFVYASWDDAFTQLCRYSGEKKNRGAKDDICDVLAYAVQFG
jgi:predicted phage terminase large subunit-like protein